SIEAIFSILALQQNYALPNLNYKKFIAEHELVPVNSDHQKTARPIDHVINNSMGMGGFCSTLVLSKN
ncbi:MAG: beta-ketoacyl-[acyl-carrier-protein] synthase family protein, partial [Bacteroidota bacterium]